MSWCEWCKTDPVTTGLGHLQGCPDDLSQRGEPITDGERRSAWLADRKTVITGTDAAKILGVSKFGGPMDVWLDKHDPASVELATTNALEAGRRFERPILEWYADDQNVPIQFADPYQMLRSATFSRIGATLDAQRTDFAPYAPVDAKNLRYQTPEWGEPGTDVMPTYYAAQLVWQMHVTGASFADLAVVFSGQDLCVYRLYRDESLERELVEQCQSWWVRHIDGDEPPPVEGSASYTRYLQDRVRQTSEAVIEATPELHERARLLNEVKGHLETFEQEKEYYQNVMKVAIGEGKKLVGANWSATWTQAKDSTKTDWEAVARACDPTPELIAQHTITKPGARSFRFTFKESAV